MTDTAYAELEIGLHQWSPDSYSAELRYTPSGQDGAIEVKIVHGLCFDFAGLRDRWLDPVAYGRLLTEDLFRDATMRETFVHASSQAPDLRLRLFVDPNVPQLHGLRWETLRDPRSEDGASLVTNEHILFTRYLSNTGYVGEHQFRLRARSELRALIVIANPT